MHIRVHSCHILCFGQAVHCFSEDFVFKIVSILQDPIRWKPLEDVVDGYSPTLPHLKGLQNGDTATSAIKQVMHPYKQSIMAPYGSIGKPPLLPYFNIYRKLFKR